MTVLSRLLGRREQVDAPLVVDTETPRLPLLHKYGPIIEPFGPWGAVFGGRPIAFHRRDLIYFCAQPSYDTRQPLVVCLAERRDGRIHVDTEPVLSADIERRGIDVPAFTVWRNQIVAVYLDDFGPLRTERGWDTRLIVARSSDGRRFDKTAVGMPFSHTWTRVGQPWLLAADGHLIVYWRARKASGDYLIRSMMASDLSRIETILPAIRLPRQPTHVAVARRAAHFFLFYGSTLDGGLYVVSSDDGTTFDFSREVMLVGEPEEPWETVKMCASPDNGGGSMMRLCYLGENDGALAIGDAHVDAYALLRAERDLRS